MKLSKSFLSSNIILNEIEKIRPGEVFDRSKFTFSHSQKPAFNKLMSDLINKGLLKRVIKGKFVKTDETLEEKEIVEAITTKEGEVCGYLTGQSLYYEWRITEEKSKILWIAFLPVVKGGVRYLIGLAKLRYR